MSWLDYFIPKKHVEPTHTDSPRSKQVHQEKNEIAKKLFQLQRELDAKTKRSNDDFSDISDKLGSVAEEIAAATGRT